MRNLKRALSLALAVVMVVGLMIVGAGAASVKYDDFGDKAEIKNEEAVRLLVDLGVINGGNDGKFSPNGTLTRGQFAKIAYMVMIGQDNYNLYEGMSMAGDASGKWYEGAMVWCNTWRNQIITGGNDGKFYGDDTLTVVQCAVMMLRVLGYNNYLEGFTGNGWDVRTMNKARELGLMAGLENLKADAPISRDNACQMAYNALFCQTVRHEEQWNPTAQTMVPSGYEKEADGSVKKNPALATSTFKVVPTTAVVTSIAADGKVSCATVKADGSLEAAAVVADLTATPDMVGTTITYYVKDGKLLTAAKDAATKVVATIDGGNFGASIKSPMNPNGYELDNATFYLNGDKKANQNAAEIKAGSVVELVNTDADAKIEVVRVTNKTYGVVGADPEIKTQGPVTNVTIQGVLSATNVNNVKGYENLKKGDAVLSVKIGAVTYIEKAESITGKITAISGDTDKQYTVNGSKLTKSGLVQSLADTDFKNEYNFFLDNGGHIVAIVKAGEAPDPTPVVKYAVTQDFGFTKTGVSGAIGAEAEKYTWQVQLLLPTGEKKVVEMVGYTTSTNVYGLTAVEDDPTTDDVDETVTAFTEAIVVGTTNPAANGLKQDNVGKIVSYTEKDGKYTLEEVGANVNAGTLTGGKANFTGNLLGNKDTIFLVQVGDEENVRVFTGVANLPSTESNGLTSGQSFNKDKTGGGKETFVHLAYLKISAIKGATDEQTAYFIDNSKYTQTANGYEVQAVVDGEIVTLTVDAEKWTNDIKALKAVMKKVTYTDGKVTKVENATGYDTLKNVVMESEFVKATEGGDNNYYQIDSDTVIYTIGGGRATLVTPDKLAGALDGKNGQKIFDVVVKKDSTNTLLLTEMFITERGFAAAPAVSAEAAEVTLTDGSAALKVVVPEGTTYSKYEWFKDEETEAISGATTNTYTAQAAGTYKCVVTNHVEGLRDSTKTVTFTVKAAPATGD